ncbi:hypothetical protein H6G17_04090 [Chroococcidiopsis sp. FACHB-1243]|uniref:hypothetical protein n=1 Tax=Chroococcidiopsis sp. [FACHB-1243] TaxID=2692781 RepID=UPI0017851A08|nr:hypothetical protein [Chroococcidiopsis sp. [FACHB-1243]]MBD2304697.1 hypothetical protein [Chroococcidiopsis sp. [FACHB-1243]]
MKPQIQLTVIRQQRVGSRGAGEQVSFRCNNHQLPITHYPLPTTNLKEILKNFSFSLQLSILDYIINEQDCVKNSSSRDRAEFSNPQADS